MTQSHDDFTSRLSEYLDGELSAQEHQAFEDHLGGCEECRNSLRELRTVVTRVQDAGADASAQSDIAALWPRVASSLVEVTRADTLQMRGAPSVWPARLVAAGLLVTMGFAGGAWFGRAQCTGAIPWTSSAWIKAGLASLGVGATTSARTTRVKSNSEVVDSAREASADSVTRVSDSVKARR